MNAPTPAALLEPMMMSGFGNEFASEALPGALPVGRKDRKSVV